MLLRFEIRATNRQLLSKIEAKVCTFDASVKITGWTSEIFESIV